MIIKGKRLSLRTVREKDLDALYDLVFDAAARGPYYPIFIWSETEYKREFQQNGFWSDEHGELLICDLEDRMLGEVYYFRAAPYFDGYELAYRLFDVGQSNRGVMTEAVTLFTYLLFCVKKINRLELKIMPENIASKRVAEKCGYVLEGVARGAFFHRGAYRDLEVWSILRQEARTSLEDVLAGMRSQ